MGFFSLPRKTVAVGAAGVIVVSGLAGVAISRSEHENGPRYRGYLEKFGGEHEEEDHGVESVVGGPASESSEIYNAMT
ncbi:MAG: hypothetical protein QOJ49_834, partial [Actinomycetota bacterium]|nr:hypothetical protein [Actinomycetota bacterium]